MMKNRIFLIFCWMAIASFASAQLPRIVLQPDGGGSPQVFLSINEAISAATEDDRIYLSGGGFQSSSQIILNFPLHFIGAGIHPDSTVVTNPTTLSTSLPIIVTNGASNSSFTGIKFLSQSFNNIIFGNSNSDDDPTGLYFERCEFQNALKLTSVSLSEQSNSETQFNECVFRGGVLGAINTSASFARCIFANSSEIAGLNGGGLVVDHCLFFGDANISNSTASIVRNSIFTGPSPVTPLYQCGGSIVQNCMTLASQWFGDSSGSVSNSYNNETNPFAGAPTNDFTFINNHQILGTSVASGGALDGTDMGIYGSSAPAKIGVVPYNPHFIEVEIAPATDANGNLPVSIKVQAQSY